MKTKVIWLLPIAVAGCSGGVVEDGLEIDQGEGVGTSEEALLSDTLSPAVFVGANRSCIIENRKLYCAGQSDQYGQKNYFIKVSLPGLPEDVDKVAIGRYHTCVISDGTVYCWGDNRQGNVGHPSWVGMSDVPPVPILSNTSDIVANEGRTCAIAGAASRVFCWGSQGSTPTPVCMNSFSSPCSSYLDGVQKLALGTVHTCALMNGGGVTCWGSNGFGQLGVNKTPAELWSSSVPLSVGLPAAADQIVAGGQHTCALAGGNMYCWGGNDRGQLHPNTSLSAITVAPTLVVGGASYIAAGKAHSCAIAGGAVLCWGSNVNGQLLHGQSPDPAQYKAVLSGWGAARVVSSVDADHTLVQHQNGQLLGRGRNNFGQLGCGSGNGVGTDLSNNWCDAFDGALLDTFGLRAENTTVVAFYRGFLGRTPDRGGYVYWTNRLRAAQCKPTLAQINDEVRTVTGDVANQFLICDERRYFRGGGLGGNQGTYADAQALAGTLPHLDLSRFNGSSYGYDAPSKADDVYDIYQSILQREPDGGGFNYWTQQVLGGLQASALINAFLGSPEYNDPTTSVLARIGNAGCMPSMR